MRPITSKSSSGAADWQLDAAMAANITLDALFMQCPQARPCAEI
jgi:hypothetical protein